jgi:hypothetical protein
VSEQSGSPAMSRVVVAISVVFVIVALLVVFGGGDEPTVASQTPAVTSRTGAAGSAPDPSSAFEELGRGASDAAAFGKAGDLGTNLDNEDAARLREIREAQERPMPASVARDFERGMAEPTDEELEALRRGMDEMPPHVARDLAEAPTRLIPTGVRESFENPYPPISEEDLKALRQRGPETVTP